MKGRFNLPGWLPRFLRLFDTPSSYAGQAGKAVIVNAEETGLDFGDVTGGGGLSEIPFEFCVNAGVAETFHIDVYAAGYTISHAILESDGVLQAVQVKIGATAITGLDAMDVSVLAVFTATAANVAAAEARVTLVTSGTDTGTPTIIRGKILLA